MKVGQTGVPLIPYSSDSFSLIIVDGRGLISSLFQGCNHEIRDFWRNLHGSFSGSPPVGEVHAEGRRYVYFGGADVVE